MSYLTGNNSHSISVLNLNKKLRIYKKCNLTDHLTLSCDKLFEKQNTESSFLGLAKELLSFLGLTKELSSFLRLAKTDSEAF